MMKVLISGITGFIGSRLCAYLIDRGYTVFGIARNTSNIKHLKEHLEQVFGEKSAALYLRNNLYFFSEYEEVFEILKRIKPDCTVNLAGFFVSEHTESTLEKILDSNVVFSTYLVDACQRAGCYDFISTTSYWEHYHKDDYNPVNLYASTKKAMEEILYYYHQRKRISIVIITIFDTYGKGDWRGKLLNVIRDMNEGESIDLSHGMQRLHMVYIEDVCRGYETVIRQMLESTKKEPNFKKYSLFAQKSYSLREIVQKMLNYMNKDIIVNFGARPMRECEIEDSEGIGVGIPGYTPQVSLEKGLQIFLGTDLYDRGF